MIIAFIAGCITVAGLGFIGICWSAAVINELDREDYRLKSMRDYQ